MNNSRYNVSFKGRGVKIPSQLSSSSLGKLVVPLTVRERTPNISRQSTQREERNEREGLKASSKIAHRLINQAKPHPNPIEEESIRALKSSIENSTTPKRELKEGD